MMERHYKLLGMTMGAILLLVMPFLAKEMADYVEQTGSASIKNEDNSKNLPCVVIDAGHGGNDPGKVGKSGVLEKNINLQIAEKLKMFLEQEDIYVVMTRTEDAGLYDSNASNKKYQDMQERLQIMEKAAPRLVVSIHQNSYPEEYVKGAQVFYYNGSVEGQGLADKIQTQLVKTLAPDNKRQIKANDSYYLLKKTALPIVIVECGFLSNEAEELLLSTDYYQEKTAWCIHLGILQYLNEED